MKTFSSSFLILTICLTTFTFSCEGPEGPAGAAGAKGDTGAPGAAGIKGDKGDTGTANVVYTEWFAPAWNEIYRSPDNLYTMLNVTNTAQAILTEDAVNKSAIHIYIRYNERIWNSQEGEWQLHQRITASRDQWGYAKIPDRSSNNVTDFHQIGTWYETIGKNYFKPTLQINTNLYDAATQKEIAIGEYIGKTAAQMRELAKDMAQFRIVVIPGAVLSGRQKVLNFDDYEEVKEAFGLED